MIIQTQAQVGKRHTCRIVRLPPLRYINNKKGVPKQHLDRHSENAEYA
jgi:hypothetical protein